jgi:hypothetical protein
VRGHRAAAFAIGVLLSSGAAGASSGGGERLLARLGTCSPISTRDFATDAGRRRTVPICGVKGAIWWTADMDIDCDGLATSECNSTTDPLFQPQTALEPGGVPLDAAATRYMVIPQPSRAFDYRRHGVALGAVAAIVYRGQVTFAVFGDVGPKPIIGEASYATAADFGLDTNPSTGGADRGVTYVVFPGTAVADPTSNDSIDAAGRAALAAFLGKR